MNEEVAVKVYSSEELSKMSYFVTRRNQILLSESVEVSNQKDFTFKFVGAFEMIPKAKLLIYYLRSNGDIISETLDMEFKKQLMNKVDLNVSNDKCKPGEEVDIRVTSKPTSFVGLLGIDKSVIILKSGNDLSETDIFDLEEEYHHCQPRWYCGVNYFDRKV